MSRHYLDDPSATSTQEHCDVLVIGSGIAGMMTALHLAEKRDVYLITKASIDDGSTRFAQGGIAFAISSDDSTELHIKDTLEAGVDFCDEEMVQILVEEGPERYLELVEIGARFDNENGKIDLHREGGHSRNRIVHSGDSTGEEVSRTIVEAVRSNDRITVLENAFMVDLIGDGKECSGAHISHNEQPITINANVTVLASGGAGQLFSITTSPSVVTGDGIAAAMRAGARIADMEFIQFHPTALHEDINPRFLITEAIRGEGALLLDSKGNRFMLDKHPLVELAPRDVVVRNMALRMIRTGADHLFLDLRHFSKEKMEEGFPNISKELAEKGYDTGHDLIPISFAAHYTIGGVATDASGRTSLKNLYACGETACTGVHGANRLASNSLLEGLVFSRRIAIDILKTSKAADFAKPTFRGPGKWEKDPVDIATLKEKLGAAMIRYGGVFRAEKRLAILHNELNMITEASLNAEKSLAWFELQNMLLLARCIHDAGMMRCESRGAHQRQEFPDHDPVWGRQHIIFEHGKQSLIKQLAEGIQ